MNEKIKQLWRQVELQECDCGCNPDEFLRLKFAESIVRECMNIADVQKKYVEDMVVFNEHDANWNRARIQQSQQIVDKIKQHFGVEE